MDEKTRIKSLRFSLFDGIFANIMSGLSETFMTPYAIAMRAGSSLIGILSAMPNLANSLLQIKSAILAERLGSRKALINSAVLVHALMWLPIIAIPYVFANNQAVYLVIFYTMFVAIGGIASPAWSSLMADHVPETERGKVFGWRNRLFGLVNVTSMFAAGLILYLSRFFSSNSFKFFGFTLIFSIAFIARLISWNFLTRMHEPVLVIRDEHKFTFFDFLKRMGRANFGKFVIFVSSMSFAVYLGSPFFAVYMLRDLGFNYLTYAIITMAATLTSLCMMGIWGKYADRVGNLRILKLTSIFIPFIPVLWLFSRNVLYLIIMQIFSGFFWAGYNLSVTNFIYDAVTPEKRTRCIAYFNVINGVGVFSGAAIGGYLLNILPPFLGYRTLSVLLISGIFRLVAATLSSFVKEVRKIKDMSNLELFYSIIGLGPNLRQNMSLHDGKE